MKRQLNPVKQTGGTITVPGDKSIAHRAVLLSLVSSGPIELVNFPDNHDCASSLRAVEQFGVTVQREDTRIVLTPPEAINISLL